MKVRRLLVLTALVSSVLGAAAVYLAMTVPNDLKAGALLKEARAHVAAGRNEQGRDALSQIVQHYPRTDAAAAATVALLRIEGQERQRLQKDLALLRADSERQAKAVAGLQKNLESVRNTPARAATADPAPAKKVTTASKPPAKKTTTKKSTKKKPTTRKPRKK